jgi:hypothetical protein
MTLTIVFHGNLAPNDGQHTAGQGHPHHRHRGRNAGGVVAKVQFGQQEGKGRTLHTRFNGHGTGGRFAEFEHIAGDKVARQATQEMQQKNGDLQHPAGGQDGARHLGDSGGDQETGTCDTDDGSKGQDGFHDVREEAIQRHADDNGCQDYLNRRQGNAGRVYGNDRSENALTEQRRHDDGTERGGGGHENRERYVAAGNVRAQVARLATIGAANQDESRNERCRQTKSFTQSIGQSGHHGVAHNELHDGWCWSFSHLDKVIGCQCNAHGQHERGETSGKVFSREPGKGLRRFQGNQGKQYGPNGEQIGKQVGRLFVSLKNLLPQSLGRFRLILYKA